MDGGTRVEEPRSRLTRSGPKPVEIWARALSSMKTMASDPAQTLLELVERVAQMAVDCGRGVATVTQARAMLSLPAACEPQARVWG